MSEYSKFGKAFSQINVVRDFTPAANAQNAVSKAFYSNQSQSKKSGDSLNNQSNSGLSQINSTDKDVESKPNRNSIKNTDVSRLGDNPKMPKSESYEFEASEDASSVSTKKVAVPEKDDEVGTFGKMMDGMKQSAMESMMGDATSSLNNDPGRQESDSGPQQDSIKKTKDSNVGKIPALNLQNRPIPTDLPQQNTPTTTIPSARAPQMSFPKIKVPKIPKF
jgi:hypothetical protein